MTAPATAPATVDISEHQQLVRWVMKTRGFARRAFGANDAEDLFQVGMLGLHRAALTFDPVKGAWATYATWHIRASIGRYLQNTSATVRVPAYLQEKRWHRGERCGVTMRSIHAKYRGAFAEDDSTFEDVLADPEALSPEDEAQANRAADQVAELFDRARLRPKHRLVLSMRAKDYSLQEIGDHLGVSRERIRQLEVEALDRVRAAAGVSDAPHVAITRAASSHARM